MMSPIAIIPSASGSFETIIEKEMCLFENGGNRGQCQQLAYEYLLAIPPKSVESERAFSVAGSFVTKVKSSLGNESINALVEPANM
ncbi:hAT family C-terminal dimerization region [Popillia japonica]|uniref:HAT family C-terminal dimerization region n=1 Tax=Popillia japonica TaxID=7064 RepID=A0AAW1J090_POPJA